MDENSQMSEFGYGTPEPEGAALNSGINKLPTARACDYCRQRKAGCSREKPQCRNCKNAKRQCTYTDPVLRKENPTVKISGQLSTLGSRLSRIESLLPSLNQASQSPPTLAESEATSERLSIIEKRIDTIDAKLDNITSLLQGLARFANKAAKAADAAGAPIRYSVAQRRCSTTESDITGHDGLEDDLATVGDSLLSDYNGNTQYLGRSSNYSFTADAEMLVQSRLRGMKHVSLAGKDSNIVDNNGLHRNSPLEHSITDWRDKEVIEDEEDSIPLSGMAMHLGDMHMGVDAPNSRERSVPIEIAPSHSGLDEPSNVMLDEAAELAGVGGTKNGGIEDYYIPTEEERHILLDRIYNNLAVSLPLFCNIPSADLMARLFQSPSRFLAETHYDTSWVTIAYCLAYYGLGFEPNKELVQRRKELVLKRAMARNAWASFKDLRLFLTPGLEHVQALMMLSIIAQDTSRPGLCWMLTCQACRLAQAMGLHRRVDQNSHGLTSADIELRKYLFWTLYVLDKSFSLSFGRTSCFQDYDCDVEIPISNVTSPTADMAPTDVMACFHPEYFRAMVELAKLQSAVYKKLYSARASNTKGRSRSWAKETEKWVWELDSRLRMWKEGLNINLVSQAYSTLLPETHPCHEDVIISLENMEFAYHTLMTMIHRRLFRPAAGEYDDGEVMSGPNTRKRSRNILLLSARSAIHVVRKLGELRNIMKTKWLILYHPFAPFFVLFSKIVTSPGSPTNDLDIELMHQVGKFLQNVRAGTHVPGDSPKNGERDEEDGVNKFLTVVQAFIRVAKSFMKRDKERIINTMQLREMREKAQDLNSQEMMNADSAKLHNTNNVPEILEATLHILPTSQPLSRGACPAQNPPSPNITRIDPQQQSSGQAQVQQQQHQLSPPATQEQPQYPSYPSPPNPFLQPQTPLPQTPLGYDCGQGDFVHWNSIAAAQSMLSMNHLQDLAGMDVDMNMGVETLHEEIHGYPEVFVMNPQEGSGEVPLSNNEMGDYNPSGQAQRTQPGPGVGNNLMEMFETAVRQGAMDFDWINWDA